MSVTDELREWAVNHRAELDMGQLYPAMIHDIADRIDAEHEKVVRERRRSCVYYDPERHYCSCHDIDVSGYVELPKDADGEYIQPSDIPRLTKANDGKRLVFYPSLELRQDGTWSLAGWTPDRYRISKPTVEDVLAEFGIDWEHESDCEDRAALLKEYAAKLKLAEEDA